MIRSGGRDAPIASLTDPPRCSWPFGGYNRSGLGRESGIDAIHEFLQVKSVWISTKPSTANSFVLR